MPARRLITFLLVACACRSTPEAVTPEPAPIQAASPAPAPRAPAREAPPDDDATLQGLRIEPLPVWTDRYADDWPTRPLFLNISETMRRYALSRAQAVEVQNLARDRLAASPQVAPRTAIEQAVALVRAGAFEQPYRPDVLAQAPFIVVFDLDDTLYDQYYDPKVAATCFDVAVPVRGGEHRFKLAPRWKDAFDRIRALGGAIVLFSANLDAPTRANLARWEYEGRPLLEHPAIAAVLTNNHLVQQARTEGTGADNPRRGRPVLEPSKDLRVFDETLQRVIIVDDNPSRLFQFRNTRVVPKFDAAAYCESDDPTVRTLADGVLPQVVREIEDAAATAKQNDISFANAYLPYSLLGRVTLDALELAGVSREKAISWVRTNPQRVPDDF